MSAVAATGSAPVARSTFIRSPFRASGWQVVLRGYIGLFLVFLYGPLVVLFVLSFNDSDTIGLPFRGFTLRWYTGLVHQRDILLALGNSILLGVAVAVLSCLLALTMALGFRATFSGKPLLLQIILLPVIIPGVVGGIMLLIFLGYLGFPFGLFTSILVAQATYVMPFAFLTLYPRIQGFDKSLEEAAQDLGAEGLVLFRRIVLPIIMPGILATTIFCFTLSFDEFIRSVFVVGQDATMPLLLWSVITQNAEPYIPAVGVLNIAVSAVTSIIGFALAARAARQPR
ncbi:ABC transporter permease [Enterovirga rhinocerotis]|uniref:Putative spermidine/putrescine transport system permease protein/spermidine/putrescine transport system permease protein n=1 Tax=Enterovirga rhinocerotis TaxID=1339210 RepID=A0A4R7C4Y3_9HYPH|nr:ABC transporter permease [Enterovirga rhinocerotis]TDR92912.1 putative spermidine/putrescine transport system permease protein/spermidine/putrescine transport system permease protein [Enterovirga rhinocerotis]